MHIIALTSIYFTVDSTAARDRDRHTVISPAPVIFHRPSPTFFSHHSSFIFHHSPSSSIVHHPSFISHLPSSIIHLPPSSSMRAALWPLSPSILFHLLIALCSFLFIACDIVSDPPPSTLILCILCPPLSRLLTI
eukprot:m.151086 g.151086  ORF g.151086 m.151086 type:complete len:135 (-) comp16191_c0_seq5:3365-3769(-)